MMQKIMAFFMAIATFFSTLFSSFTIIKPKLVAYENLIYGDYQRNVMDMYLPTDYSGELGVVLFIHGGGWVLGDKQAYTDDAQSICKDKNVAAITMNYRFVDENTTADELLDDITAALNKACDVAAQSGITLTNMMTVGFSAGGHLALLYAYSRQSQSPVKPVAVADYSGLTDLFDENLYDPSSENTEDICHTIGMLCGKELTPENISQAESELKYASPISYVASAVPTIINHSEKDNVVPYSNAVSLKNALTDVGVRCDFVSYRDSSHTLKKDRLCRTRSHKLLYEYVDTYLK